MEDLQNLFDFWGLSPTFPTALAHIRSELLKNAKLERIR